MKVFSGRYGTLRRKEIIKEVLRRDRMVLLDHSKVNRLDPKGPSQNLEDNRNGQFDICFDNCLIIFRTLRFHRIILWIIDVDLRGPSDKILDNRCGLGGLGRTCFRS